MSVEQRKIKKIVRTGSNKPLAEKEITGKAVKAIPAKGGKNGERELKPARDSTPRTVEGMVTLTQLAAARNIQAQLARLWVKKAGINKPSAGWAWKDGSKELTRVRKALGLTAA